MQGFFRKKYVSVSNNAVYAFTGQRKERAHFPPILMMYTHFQKAELGELGVDIIGEGEIYFH